MVLPEPPNFVFYLLFVARVSSGEGLGRFAYILPMALLAGTKIDNKRALVVDLLFDLIGFSCVCALEI